ncbi:hypothetical protein EDD16DRAFT_1640945 [Pisolithus croceorrhizus]|nr:hypothetical protein EDD16DRAFT_1640945 [Pisolithus croceorrhizus]
MEKAPGLLLSDVLEDLPSYDRGMFAKTLGEYERKLLDLRFTHYGSLYYKNDVPAPLRAPTLIEGLSPDDELNSNFASDLSHREHMDIDRGPWRTAEDYMKAVASREQQWIADFGTPHILDDPNRVLPGKGNRDDHIKWLSLYTDLIPALIPPLQEQKRPVLWHPDLHASNIFIRSSKKKGKVSPAIPVTISSIIDWQGAWIGPAFLQLKVPPLYRTHDVPPGRLLPAPDDFDSLSGSEKETAKEIHQQRIRHKLFEVSAFPPEVLDMEAREERVYLKDLAQSTWKYGLIPFRCVHDGVRAFCCWT